MHVGCHIPRTNTVDSDCVRSHLEGKGFREANHGGLRSTVNTEIRETLLTVPGTYVDDTALLLLRHDASRRAAAIKCAAKIDADDAVECFIGQVCHRRHRVIDSGIVHHDVQLAQSFDGLLDHPVDFIRFRYVDRHPESAVAWILLLKFLGRVIHIRRQVSQHDMGPFLSEP